MYYYQFNPQRVYIDKYIHQHSMRTSTVFYLRIALSVQDYESLDLGGQLVLSNCSRRSGYDEC